MLENDKVLMDVRIWPNVQGAFASFLNLAKNPQYEFYLRSSPVFGFILVLLLSNSL